MNLSDLCAKGREAYEEFEKFGEAFRLKGRVQSMAMMYVKHEEFLGHLRECESCTPMEEELGDA